jgi:uncharacterized membrane protein
MAMANASVRKLGITLQNIDITVAFPIFLDTYIDKYYVSCYFLAVIYLIWHQCQATRCSG